MLATAAESIVVVVVIAVVETGLDVGAAVAGRSAAVDAVVVPVHAVFCVDSHDSAWQKSFHRFHI